MNPRRVLFAVIPLIFALSPAARAQDLLQRARESVRNGPSGDAQVYRGRDRLDLALGADIRPETLRRNAGTARLGLQAGVDADFACGRFDVKANLKHLFGKEAREEMVDGLVNWALSELTSNGLTLLCEASPTVCQVFQHYRVNANAMLKVNYDWCAALEQGIDNGLQKAQAQAVKSCMEEKRLQGMSVDQARQACQNTNKMAGIGGTTVVDLNVVSELARALNLTPEDRATTELLLNDLKFTPKGASGEIKADVIPEIYAKRREEYLAAWNEVMTDVEAGNKPSPETLAKLSPRGAPRVYPEEVEEVARLSPPRRRLYVERMAGAAALLSLTTDVHKVERQLAVAKKDPAANEGVIRFLETERQELRRQLEQLRELHALQENYNRTLASFSEAGRAKVQMDAARAITAIDGSRAAERALREVPRYGTFEEPRPGGASSGQRGASAPRQGAGCNGSGSTLNFGPPPR